MDSDKMKYSDIISPDNSITQLIEQLESFSQQYETMINAIRAGAKEIIHGMKSASGATKEGRAAIDENVAAASRLEAAYKELKFAMSSTGQEVAFVKQQIKDTNVNSVHHQQALNALNGSYNKLKLELQENIRLWKALSEAERSDVAIGGQILANIRNVATQIRQLDSELKVQVVSLTEVQKAEQKLNFLRSEEGQRLLELKRQINEVIRESRGEAQTKDELAAAYEKLNHIQSEYYAKLQSVNAQIKEHQRIAKLTAQINNSEAGSYNQLAAQYELNKIKLNAMSHEMRNSTQEGKRLEEETRRIYQQMIVLQEATGNHRLSVGNYAKSWNGLRMSVMQVVRELPAAAVGFNTFILAISNNIPILIDEIERVREKNQALIAQGKPTENVAKTIAGAIFNWQTALIILMTVLAQCGDKILDWIASVSGAEQKMKSLPQLLRDVTDEMENTNGNYGENVVLLKKLQTEYKNLKTEKEKTEWIKNNQTEFRKLNTAVRTIIEADNLLIKYTPKVVEAFKLRAQAAAAYKLAAAQYEKVAMLDVQIENYENNPMGGMGPWESMWFLFRAGAGNYTMDGMFEDANEIIEDELLSLKKQRKAANALADSYFKVAEAKTLAANVILENEVNVGSSYESYESYEKTGGGGGGGGGEPIDLTDRINRNHIEIQKKYEQSITALVTDEYLKRKKAILDTSMTEIAQLRERKRKNEEFIKNEKGKYKALTDEQKKQIKQQNDWIEATIGNIEAKKEFDLAQLEKDRAIQNLVILRESLDYEIGAVMSSIEQEKNLKVEQLENEKQYMIAVNTALSSAGRKSEEITAEYARKRLMIEAKYDKKILELKKANIKTSLELAQKGSYQEYLTRLAALQTEYEIELKENVLKPADQREDPNDIYRRYRRRRKLYIGEYRMERFDDYAAMQEAKFNSVEHTEDEITKFTLNQEKKRLQRQLTLVRLGYLNWSDAQIKAAKYTIQGIDRELGEIGNVFNKIRDKGLAGGLLSAIGFKDDQIEAMTEAADIIIDNISAIMEAELEAAEAAVEAAEKRVEAAQTAYDAEVEARNNGYAHNVATAKKELEQERKNKQAKQKLLEDAQRKQEQLDTLSQASSLITASANLWSAFSKIPVAGPALAAAAIAAMWASFIAAKVKAKQVTASASEEYGEGGIEFLEGGSHASGNDIELGVNNKRNKRMKAEGGEALAIINKRNTKKYKKVLPSIIESLNKGTFEDKYLNAFTPHDDINVNIDSGNNIDLSNIEANVQDIKKQNETRYYVLADGTIIMQRRNIKRIIKK